MDDLLHNRLIWTAVSAALLAQGLKVFLSLFTEPPAKAFSRILETGGMPSAHSAAVTALAVGVGINHGWSSPLFALTAIFGYVIYDATGIRRHAGMHAALLNRLMHELRHLIEDDGQAPREALKTLLGHTYPQVLAGILLGIAVGTIGNR